MNKEEIYLDLSKLSDKQIKDIVIIINKGQKIHKDDKVHLIKGLYDNDCHFLSIREEDDEDDKEWVSFTNLGFNLCLKTKPKSHTSNL